MDDAEQELLAETLRKTMTAVSGGAALDAALTDLGWPELLAEQPEAALSTVFLLLGETGAHAPVLNDVMLGAAGRPVGGTVPLPYAGGSWVVWHRTGKAGTALDAELPLERVTSGASAETAPSALAAGRRALGWWLLGTGRAMLALARAHALDRAQFGRPIASFQAVRHRLAETYVALEGAEAALRAAGDAVTDEKTMGTAGEETMGTAGEEELGAMLAKAAAGQAALTAARHCQQVLGGIGFTAEHDLHRHVRRALVLDGLLGGERELTRAAGAVLRQERRAPRLVRL